MKYIYEAPEMEIVILEAEDVLAISVSEGKGSLEEISWDTLS